ncbi:MAG: tRNA pseudouridine(38-40) synthase TruA [Oscillatoriales cyanobacterium SM2_1_8]|nr:tRNA pseudouridine(38-40) synthase TruA [Oscillatoriales cyanobacterium SM2_1_8]
MVTRVALLLQYRGTHYKGWQTQPNGLTVQEVLERCLQEVHGHPVAVHGAGRTDTGVHASGQVAHFDTALAIPPERWARVLNGVLPKDIAIRTSAAVPEGWHARFTAIARSYRYTIYSEATPNLFLRDFSWHYYYGVLDVEQMNAALQPLLGEQDLAALRRSGSPRPHSQVNVMAARCWRQPPFVWVDVQASGFLYGMMRLLVGLLVEVGTGRRSVADFTRIWQGRRREEVRYAAPPQGLCLVRVDYPDNPFAGADGTEVIAELGTLVHGL